MALALRSRAADHRTELGLQSPCAVEMKGNQTVLVPRHGVPDGEGAERVSNLHSLHRPGVTPLQTFTFDFSFWSVHAGDPHFASLKRPPCSRPADVSRAGQEHVFDAMGTGVLQNSFEGYNACIFAYGQTGARRPHVGSILMRNRLWKVVHHDGHAGGPRCDTATVHGLVRAHRRGACFQRCEAADAAQNTDANLSYKVEVSYMEIYNEKVRDLLGDVHSKAPLKVREHTVLGPYVEVRTRLLLPRITRRRAWPSLPSRTSRRSKRSWRRAARRAPWLPPA